MQSSWHRLPLRPPLFRGNLRRPARRSAPRRRRVPRLGEGGDTTTAAEEAEAEAETSVRTIAWYRQEFRFAASSRSSSAPDASEAAEMPFLLPADRERYVDGLRSAGSEASKRASFGRGQGASGDANLVSPAKLSILREIFNIYLFTKSYTS